jgi:hypothetical protein
VSEDLFVREDSARCDIVATSLNGFVEIAAIRYEVFERALRDIVSSRV